MEKIYDTKSNFVFDLLKERILQGQYAQGESVVISRVADELNISAIPVREALKRLESEGLVEIIPHKGAQVTSFNQEKVSEVLVIRAVLEGYATGEIAKIIDEVTLQNLEKMNAEMALRAKEGDDEAYSYLNKEFHRHLFKLLPNQTLFESIFNLWDGGNWSKSIFAFFPETMKESIQEHTEILSALKLHDSILAEQLARKHKMKNIPYYIELSKRTT